MTAAPTDADNTVLELLERKEQASGFDAFVENAGERLNPILVKEARQALKSKQFLITFMLLLACGWGWTVLGVALQAGAVYYAESGLFMLSGYFVVLAVPLMIIVPFASFRSIAAEKDYGTFELLSITSLNSRQIVTGKLAVSVLQIMVYLSTLAPFVAFTYLLRGIDLVAILYVLGMTVMLSLLFSAISILVGTLARSTHWQVVLSVVLLGAVGGSTIFWVALVLDEVLDSSAPFLDPGFWLVNAVIVIMMLTYVVVAVVAGASMVSFASDNRSTPIRVVLLIQQAIFTACMVQVWIYFGDDDFFFPLVILPAISWAVAGALMTSELGELSARVKRSLPQTAFGRALLTWFFPGSGSGYVFSASSYAAIVVVVVTMTVLANYFDWPGAPNNSRDNPIALAVVLLSYVVGYLGIGRIAILLIRKRYSLGLFGGLIVHAIIVVLGAVAPTVFQLLLHRVFGSEYGPLQAGNWAWTTAAILDRDFYGARYTWGWPIPPTLIIAPAFAFVIFIINLVLAVREVEQVRVATPDRVREESETTREKPPKSPWDETEEDDG